MTCMGESVVEELHYLDNLLTQVFLSLMLLCSDRSSLLLQCRAGCFYSLKGCPCVKVVGWVRERVTPLICVLWVHDPSCFFETSLGCGSHRLLVVKPVRIIRSCIGFSSETGCSIQCTKSRK